MFDNGGEYDKSQLKAFYVVEKIKLIKVVLDKARYNGIGKRMKIILNEETRSTRIHYELTKTSGADVVDTKAYLINRESSIPLEFKLLLEV